MKGYVARKARVIDLDPRTVEQLHRHHERQDDERASRGNADLDPGLAFRSSDGQAMHPHSLTA